MALTVDAVEQLIQARLNPLQRKVEMLENRLTIVEQRLGVVEDKVESLFAKNGRNLEMASKRLKYRDSTAKKAAITDTACQQASNKMDASIFNYKKEIFYATYNLLAEAQAK